LIPSADSRQPHLAGAIEARLGRALHEVVNLHQCR
jgi:hypothetical protein